MVRLRRDECCPRVNTGLFLIITSQTSVEKFFVNFYKIRVVLDIMFHRAAAILLGAMALAVDIEEEAGILVLNDANFDEALKTHENILVEFYLPTCGACISFAPEYVKAASIINERGLPFKLAKVDASVEEKLIKELKVKLFPTLIFYKNRDPTAYEGGEEYDEIVDWLMETLYTIEGTLEEPSGPIHILKTADSVDAFKLNHEKSLISYCTDPKSPLMEMFKTASTSIEDYGFGWVQDASLISNISGGYIEDGNIHLYKKSQLGLFDLREVIYHGGNDVKELQKFLKANTFPAILELGPKTAQYVFNSEVEIHVLIFVSSSNGELETLVEPLMDVAQEIRERAGNVLDKSVMFVVVDVDEEDHSKLLKILGVKKGWGNVPTVRIIKLGKNGEPMKKYKPAQSVGNYLNHQRVKKFVEDFLKGNVESYLLSEKLPKDWNANPVKVLTGENFDDVALDAEKNVLVQFYSPWCGYCHRLEPIYTEVAKIFEGRFDGGRDYVIAKIDATANELDHTTINHYPTIKLYKKGTNKVVDFTGQRSVQALVKFVESGGKSIEQEKQTPHGKDEL
ncbi:hypothetical protein GE061_003706 [Apolygus lucorum]|uniref:protein disulfide-isomerase n=1 Tax=Apolygus lucorum TaxID=248454 RepID=A0A8S9X4J2_APOLU|nr:hypothetical protein GE061_003706 [Apolygus lucorum]